MVGRAGGERSSSVVEILTLHFFTYCLQHYVGLGHKIPRLFQYPMRLRAQPPLGMHYLSSEVWVLQLPPQHTSEVGRYSPNSSNSLHRVPKNTSQSARSLKRSSGLQSVRPGLC